MLYDAYIWIRTWRLRDYAEGLNLSFLIMILTCFLHFEQFWAIKFDVNVKFNMPPINVQQMTEVHFGTFF